MLLSVNKYFYRGYLLSLALGLVACDSSHDDDDDDHHEGEHDAAVSDAASDDGGNEGAFECCVLGEVCHAVDDQAGALAGCHDLGHENDGAKCIAEYDRCFNACVEAGASDEIPAMCKER
jgi:hypothetical protein